MGPLPKIAKILAANGKKELAKEIADVSLTLKQLRSGQVTTIRDRKLGIFLVTLDKREAKPLFVGTLPEVNKYAVKQGWEWRSDQSVFGGYWIAPKLEELLHSYEIDIL